MRLVHSHLVEIRIASWAVPRVIVKERVADALEGFELKNHCELVAQRLEFFPVHAIAEPRLLRQEIAMRAQPHPRSFEWGARGFAGRLIKLLDHGPAGLPADAYPRVRKIEERQSGDVSGLHPARFPLRGWNGDGADGSR